METEERTFSDGLWSHSENWGGCTGGINGTKQSVPATLTMPKNTDRGSCDSKQ